MTKPSHNAQIGLEALLLLHRSLSLDTLTTAGDLKCRSVNGPPPEPEPAICRAYRRLSCLFISPFSLFKTSSCASKPSILSAAPMLISSTTLTNLNSRKTMTSEAISSTMPCDSTSITKLAMMTTPSSR